MIRKKRILITPLDGLGDNLMTTPVISQLKKHKPNWIITYFTFNPAANQILKNNPNIDNLYYYPLKSVNFIKSITYIIKNFSFRFNTCINFYPSNRSAYNLFCLLSFAKKRLGHTYKYMNTSQLNWIKNCLIKEDEKAHCVEQNIRLLKFFDIPHSLHDIPDMKIYLTQEEKVIGQSFRDSFKTEKIVGIHAGTNTFKNHDKRRWPEEYFVKLIDRFPDIHFLLFGTADEIDLNKSIKSSISNKNQVTIVQDKSIREVASIIGELDCFISNDSGLMHIAAAMDTPVLAILGPTNQHFIYPWSVKHKISRLNLPCSPCFFYSPKPLSCKLNNSFKCLHELSVSQVEKDFRELMGL